MSWALENEDQIVELLKERVEEARLLREGLPVPAIEDGPGTVHEHLLRARAVYDRVESCYVDVLLIRGRVAVEEGAARGALESAEAEVYGSERFAEFATAAEKRALVATRTLVQRAEADRLQRLLSQVETAADVLRVMLRGVEMVRREADLRLRAMAFERQLER